MTTQRSSIESFEQLQFAIQEASQRSQELRAELAGGVESLRRKAEPLKKLALLLTGRSAILYWAGIAFGLWRRFSAKK